MIYMGLFNDMLGSDETLFKNEIALDFSFMPKLIPYREPQQRYIAACIKPLFQTRNGKNLLIFGRPGIGKTVACRHILKELEEETEEIIPIYINCWQKNTSFKISMELCELLNYKLTHNKKTDELFDVIKRILNKKSVVFVFDEIDKAEDYDFLYGILEDIYRKTIILITNHKEWIIDLEQRIKSRLMPDMLEFKPYNAVETEGILPQRMDAAFIPNVMQPAAFLKIVQKTIEVQDIRTGLHLMKEAALTAENRSSRSIEENDVDAALSKIDQSTIKSSTYLEEDERFILSIAKTNSGKKIGDLFKSYQSSGGSSSYKTFQRKIKKLEQNNFISVAKTEGGAEGNTSIIKYNSGQSRKLTDF